MLIEKRKQQYIHTSRHDDNYLSIRKTFFLISFFFYQFLKVFLWPYFFPHLWFLCHISYPKNKLFLILIICAQDKGQSSIFFFLFLPSEPNQMAPKSSRIQTLTDINSSHPYQQHQQHQQNDAYLYYSCSLCGYIYVH